MLVPPLRDRPSAVQVYDNIGRARKLTNGSALELSLALFCSSDTLLEQDKTWDGGFSLLSWLVLLALVFLSTTYTLSVSAEMAFTGRPQTSLAVSE